MFKSVKDGYHPQGGLIAGPAGSLFGTTGARRKHRLPSSYTNGWLSTGCGTVFELVPPAKSGGAWTKQILHTFTGGADGGIPLATLLADPSGSGVLYGTASTGGTASCRIWGRRQLRRGIFPDAAGRRQDRLDRKCAAQFYGVADG